MVASGHALATESAHRAFKALVTVAEVGDTVLPGAKGEVAVFKAVRQVFMVLSVFSALRYVAHDWLIPEGIKGLADGDGVAVPVVYKSR